MKTSVMLTIAATAATTNAIDFLSFGKKISELNIGMMQSMQPDPTNEYSECSISAKATGEEIVKAADFT